MHQCLICASELQVSKLHCSACGIAHAGDFRLPRLARLAPSQQQLAEQLVLAAGNLKQMAANLEISYPTLRKRLNDLVAALAELQSSDDERTSALLADVENGTVSPEAAARLIKEMHGAL